MTVRSRQQILKRFYIVYTVSAAALFFLLMVVVFPWWHTSSHPVLVSMGAPVDAEIKLGFSESEAPLDLVALDRSGPVAWSWGTELPPRPKYDLYLEFPQGTEREWMLSEIRLTTVSPKPRHTIINLADLASLPDELVRLRFVNDKLSITAEPGGRVHLPLEFPLRSKSSLVKDLAIAIWGYILISGTALILIVTALRFPDRIVGSSQPAHWLETVILCLGLLLGTLGHLHLVGQSIPSFQGVESIRHLARGLDLGSGPFDGLGGSTTSFAVLPGYGAFLSVLLSLTAGKLSGVIFFQGLLFCLSTFALAISLKRLVRGYLIALVGILALLSPMAVWSSRQITPDSFFASIWMLSMTVFVLLWQTQGSKRIFGWVVFGILTVMASATRYSGFLLLILPFFLLIGTFWWSISLRGRRFYKVPILYKTAWQAGIPFLMVLLFMGLGSLFPGPENEPRPCNSLIEKALRRSPLFAGTFDIRALGSAEAQHYFMKERLGGDWKVPDNAYPPDFLESYEQNQHLRAHLAARGRTAGWALFSPDSQAHDGTDLHRDLRVDLGFPDSDRKNLVLSQIHSLSVASGKPLSLELADYDVWVALYNRFIPGIYPTLYRILFFGALVGWIFSIVERKYLTAAIIAPFLFQMLLFVYWMYVPSRYIQVLETSLWFAFLTGWASVNPHTLQRPTDESDRRSMPPIRPQRLMTRFKSEEIDPL